MLPKFSLVLGGASSGKSDLAEHLVRSAQRAPVYVATAQAYDAEMEQKIQDHIAARGPGWRTVEAPLNAAAAVTAVAADEVLLLDCATMWLSNHLLAEHDLDAESVQLLAALGAAPCPVVVVSNEVGQGIVPDNALARRFRVAQGRLNRSLAAQADLVVGVMAGLPIILKGARPACL